MQNLITNTWKIMDVKNLYRWGMSQKFPANGFKCIEDEVFFLEVGVKYPETLPDVHNNSSSLHEKNENWKVEKWYHLYDKTEYVIHIRNSKQALNHGLVFQK